MIKKGREYGKSLNGQGAKNAIKTFLNADYGWNRSLILQFLTKLWKILRWFRYQKKYRFFSSSLLLVYDASKLRQNIKQNSVYCKNKLSKSTLGRQNSFQMGQNREPSTHNRLGGSLRKIQSQNNFDNLFRTHSLINNYERDLQDMKENYNLILNDLMGKSNNELWVNVAMIDFAHVFQSDFESIDENYLNGLQNLVDVFEEFLTETNS